VEFAAGSGRPDEFRPPDDVLGLAGVSPALPPMRLLHVGWRWYDPALGRFVQRDPLGALAGLNLYVYCGSDPLRRVDPVGLITIDELDRNINWILGWTSAGATVGQAANYKWRLGLGTALNRISCVVNGAAIGWNAGKAPDRSLGLSERIGDFLGRAWIFVKQIFE